MKRCKKSFRNTKMLTLYATAVGVAYCGNCDDDHKIPMDLDKKLWDRQHPRPTGKCASYVNTSSVNWTNDAKCSRDSGYGVRGVYCKQHARIIEAGLRR